MRVDAVCTCLVRARVVELPSCVGPTDQVAVLGSVAGTSLSVRQMAVELLKKQQDIERLQKRCLTQFSSSGAAVPSAPSDSPPPPPLLLHASSSVKKVFDGDSSTEAESPNLLLSCSAPLSGSKEDKLVSLAVEPSTAAGSLENTARGLPAMIKDANSNLQESVRYVRHVPEFSVLPVIDHCPGCVYALAWHLLADIESGDG